MVALAGIFGVYLTVGAFAAIGSTTLSRALFAPRVEQALYALFLIAIAAFYLLFAAYFEARAAFALESAAVAGFALLGLAGLRWPVAIALGYALHGSWDLLHEFDAHAGTALLPAGQSTPVPLAYGALCATFDFGIAWYALRRAEAWRI